MKKFHQPYRSCRLDFAPRKSRGEPGGARSPRCAKLLRYEHRENGYIICVNWEAGLEILAPLDQRTDYNGMMHDWLETKGESVIFVAFGVADLARHAARLEAMGIEVSPQFEDRADTPWKDQLMLRERIAGTVTNSYFVLADIDYADGLIPFGDA